ncbi:MAG: pseudouridine synthase [Lysobacterales bacterium 63-13]|nr:MAG: pseudouridine synthase [Xanthomonadales bacterium 63-13]
MVSRRDQSGKHVAGTRHGLARVMSKRGLCSRSQAEAAIRAGRVTLDGRVVRDPQTPTAADASIAIDDVAVVPVERRYLMLNKPRGTVTTANDERGRDTVYALFADAGLPWIAPVGRLDKASEGLLLFSNDSEWAARISAPESQLEKTYHVQVDRLPDADLLARIQAGVRDDGEWLAARSVMELRRGEKNAWLEIVLDEGRNRQIRRLLAALDVSVLRLIRVAIGPLQLGNLAKGQWRELDAEEVRAVMQQQGPGSRSSPS